ncbi:sporulation initiation factor Spo0A C-terminal domain-containing protein [Anaerocolumna xylanovorans]|uniref:Stage 0 sporulation protein A homolog n=1 Tax=Anaerocolumna xylanovorans DSM 12503 TaxID=1121345 RepID=A0A1M7Y2Q7_9FIRM|nr:sporulation initiation factor Spo0A C-terminal domain-containing protein [Anaerocolumna xylanovorans]SHO46017.1 Response regulator receiver domain-containing protein [Anaerocolumna xylanovorans DSM 12503]
MDRKLSILLVEDDRTVCEEFIEYIEKSNDAALIGVTNDSAKAIEYIKDLLPDVVILDLELHNGSGNGLMVLQGLKQSVISKYPYILITTNNSSPITYESARQLGADFIMSKHQADYSVKNVIEFLRIMKTGIHSRKETFCAAHSTTEPTEVKNKRIISRISSELNYVGISPKAVGYQYLIDAILLVINQPMQNLCNAIGKKYGKTESSVERAMQNAINRAWHTSDIDNLLKYYTARISSEKGVPTITEFVYYYANKIKNEY